MQWINSLRVYCKVKLEMRGAL